MNLIILDSSSKTQRLPKSDRRAEHIRKVLKKGRVDELFVGSKNGPIGKAKIQINDDKTVALDVQWGGESSGGSLYPLTLLVGMCRPQTCRKILRDAAPLGIREIRFFSSGKGEVGYASSSLWTSGEWERQLIEGVEQSFSTAVPVVNLFDSLESSLVGLNGSDCFRVACDNYESKNSIGDLTASANEVVVAIGSERGWSDQERNLLRKNSFMLADMGGRVMRSETAIVAACSILTSKSDWYKDFAFSADY